MSDIKVTLGAHEIPVYPQRHAYLTNKMGTWMSTITDAGDDVSGGQLLGFLGERSYEVLSVLIPTLPKRMPRWEWDGFGSAEAAALGREGYDEEQDNSPTVPQIIEAFETAIKVNRFDIFKALKNVVDPQLLRGWLNVQLAERLTSTTSPNSPSQSGESDPMSSGTTPPISTESEAGLSIV